MPLFGASSSPASRTIEHAPLVGVAGALEASRADAAVSVSGVADPDGGTAAKPVGLVWFACARAGAPTLAREERFGEIGRANVRLASVSVALDMLEKAAL